MKLLGLDVGERRIGVAKADTSVRIATPAGMILVDGREILNIVKVVSLNNIDVIVVGMPRNLRGEQTKQSEYVKNFVKTLNQALLLKKPNNKTVKIFFQDESLTSVTAKERLKARNGKIDKKTGDIDAEAATIILQDFLENVQNRIRTAKNNTTVPQKTPVMPINRSLSGENANADNNQASAKKASETPKNASKPQFKPFKDNSARKWAIIRTIIIITIILGGGIIGVFAWYKNSLKSPVSEETCSGASLNENLEICETVEVVIPEGSTLDEIATILKKTGIIKNSFTFKMNARFKKTVSNLKAGTYQLSPAISIDSLMDTLEKGSSSATVFRFTALPGETLKDIKKRLMAVGYEESEIDAAFSKNYNHSILADKPADASLEGYLFGETYEFYTTDSVEDIVIRMLDELQSVVQKNNLKQKFNNLGLTLHEGIILASIVQKEAGTLSKEDMSKVAQVFLSRLNQGIPLGSDVTVKYAVDQVDPNREIYKDNASALSIDSCYNTRKNAGLPCGPISNPSALVLISTANPSDTSYLYFLTGDDGLMYYSNTESEHNHNASEHCKELCNISL